MPRKVCGNHCDPRTLKLSNFIPAHTALQHIHSRNAKNHNEVRTNGLSDPAHYFQRKAHTVGITTAPLIGTLIGFLHQKSGQQIPGRTDNFNAVIPCTLSQLGTLCMIGYLFFDSRLIEF